jgi:hypothetical protein
MRLHRGLHAPNEIAGFLPAHDRRHRDRRRGRRLGSGSGSNLQAPVSTAIIYRGHEYLFCPHRLCSPRQRYPAFHSTCVLNVGEVRTIGFNTNRRTRRRRDNPLHPGIRLRKVTVDTDIIACHTPRREPLLELVPHLATIKRNRLRQRSDGLVDIIDDKPVTPLSMTSSTEPARKANTGVPHPIQHEPKRLVRHRAQDRRAEGHLPSGRVLRCNHTEG